MSANQGMSLIYLKSTLVTTIFGAASLFTSLAAYRSTSHTSFPLVVVAFLSYQRDIKKYLSQRSIFLEEASFSKKHLSRHFFPMKIYIFATISALSVLATTAAEETPPDRRLACYDCKGWEGKYWGPYKNKDGKCEKKWCDKSACIHKKVIDDWYCGGKGDDDDDDKKDCGHKCCELPAYNSSAVLCVCLVLWSSLLGLPWSFYH